MVFCLTRVELTVAASPDNVRRAITTPGGRPLHQPMVHFSPSPSSPDIVSHVANQSLPDNLANFCAYVENLYLKQCDPKIPLHYFTLLMTRQALCKLRIIDFLCRTAHTDNVDQSERDSYFMEALRMVEYDNIIQSSDMLQGFRWYTYAHFPLPAYLCLVSELRHRTTGELCERAWNVMIENHDRRGLLRRLNRNPLHIAFGRYFVKAWDAREAAELQLGRSLPTPKVITLLRATLAKNKPPAPIPPARNRPNMGVRGGQQVPVQPMMPAGPGNVPAMAPIGDMNMAPAGMPPAGMYPDKPMSQAPPPPPMSGVVAANPMMMDDSMMYSNYDNMTPMYGNPAAIQEPEAGGGMDWEYLVQLTSLSGFNPTGGYYVPGTGV
jgi:hypothetical protein